VFAPSKRRALLQLGQNESSAAARDAGLMVPGLDVAD
jgi:hypothetical protein